MSSQRRQPSRDVTGPALIVVLAYRRPAHLAKVLEGLHREGASAIRVCIDAATPGDADVLAAQEQIRSLLNAVAWADLDIRWREQHQGLAAAVCGALDEAFADAERVILLEDDCAPRAGFLDFMQGALERYEAESSIRSICGYTYPVVSKKSQPGTPVEALLQRRFCPWGWATWRDRWREYPRNLMQQIDAMAPMLSALPTDIRRDCNNQTILTGRGHIWSLPWILQHYSSGTWCVVPSRSLIDNIGFDGSGVHGLATDHFNQAGQPNDPEASRPPLSLPTQPAHDPAREAAIDAYLAHGPIFVID